MKIFIGKSNAMVGELMFLTWVMTAVYLSAGADDVQRCNKPIIGECHCGNDSELMPVYVKSCLKVQDDGSEICSPCPDACEDFSNCKKCSKTACLTCPPGRSGKFCKTENKKLHQIVTYADFKENISTDMQAMNTALVINATSHPKENASKQENQTTVENNEPGDVSLHVNKEYKKSNDTMLGYDLDWSEEMGDENIIEDILNKLPVAANQSPFHRNNSKRDFVLSWQLDSILPEDIHDDNYEYSNSEDYYYSPENMNLDGTLMTNYMRNNNVERKKYSEHIEGEESTKFGKSKTNRKLGLCDVLPMLPTCSLLHLTIMETPDLKHPKLKSKSRPHSHIFPPHLILFSRKKRSLETQMKNEVGSSNLKKRSPLLIIGTYGDVFFRKDEMKNNYDCDEQDSFPNDLPKRDKKDVKMPNEFKLQKYDRNPHHYQSLVIIINKAHNKKHTRPVEHNATNDDSTPFKFQKYLFSINPDEITTNTIVDHNSRINNNKTGIKFYISKRDDVDKTIFKEAQHQQSKMTKRKLKYDLGTLLENAISSDHESWHSRNQLEPLYEDNLLQKSIPPFPENQHYTIRHLFETENKNSSLLRIPSGTEQKLRIKRQAPHDDWCSFPTGTKHGDLDCTVWSYQKRCVLKCHPGYLYHGKDEARFTCARKTGKWIPDMEACTADSNTSHHKRAPHHSHGLDRSKNQHGDKSENELAYSNTLDAKESKAHTKGKPTTVMHGNRAETKQKSAPNKQLSVTSVPLAEDIKL
ncbi:uncharacterized protein LOC118181899 [Stegodyphus dumicola]|uniref:uncharacterized protein LOC118181899 n=1 Tax=Stegodyphus dumicola TaxID=202533 RepID=UPI0015ABED0A|nr:uncharacterized protein LOC118181899 [Stegodyphus dumicola]